MGSLSPSLFYSFYVTIHYCITVNVFRSHWVFYVGNNSLIFIDRTGILKYIQISNSEFNANTTVCTLNIPYILDVKNVQTTLEWRNTHSMITYFDI